MIGFSIIVFIIALSLLFGVSEDCVDTVKIKDGDREVIPADPCSQIVALICGATTIGILTYWTRKLWLIPIIEMFAKPDSRVIFLSVLLVLVGGVYMSSVYINLPRMLFIAIAVVLNCVLAVMAPLVSLAMMLVFGVCVYAASKDKDTKMVVLEIALVKAMIATSIVLTVIHLLGVVLSIILVLVILASTISISITIETIIWKHKVVPVIDVDAKDVTEPKRIPEIITKGIVAKN